MDINELIDLFSQHDIEAIFRRDGGTVRGLMVFTKNTAYRETVITSLAVAFQKSPDEM